jgi:protein required for attachment to host cells
MMKVLLVVADSYRARFFDTDLGVQDLEEVSDLLCPDSRLKGEDTHTDGHGRRGSSALDGKTSREANAAERFARDVCAEALRRSTVEDNVVLVAPPDFLGQLRVVMPGPLEKRVSATVNHDFSKRDAHEIGPLLEKHLQGWEPHQRSH